MSVPHDRFARPTIVEALCEVHFRQGPAVPWQEARFGEFFRRVEADFPTMEPRQAIKVRSPRAAPDVPEAMAVLGMLYRHRERPLLRQLFPDKLTVNELDPYQGWARFKTDVEAAWADCATVVGPIGVTRLGLRYINRIPRCSSDQPVGEWLAASEYYPSRLLAVSSGFFSRFEQRTQPGMRLVVTVAEQHADEGPTPVILDLDSVLEADLPVDWPALAGELDEMHEMVWAAFASTMSPQLRRHLEGGEP